MMILKTPKPEIVLRNGKPAAVILDIDDYEELLEQLEQKEDLKALAAARRKPMTFRAFDEFLTEHRSHA
jgi:PHD/YefM family antitoxin component YafN of YafNO toxin-antitoxin module